MQEYDRVAGLKRKKGAGSRKKTEIVTPPHRHSPDKGQPKGKRAGLADKAGIETENGIIRDTA